ncbi:MAG: oxidoreductase, partial [Cutibacterium acnes]|nr:oxidoreductase [Cutibacterium acnes]
WWNDGADLDVEEIFRHRLDSKAHHGVTQRVSVDAVGEAIHAHWGPVRPIPTEDEFLENVWKTYRVDHNIH